MSVLAGLRSWRPSATSLSVVFVVVAVALAGGFLLERRVDAGRRDARQTLQFIAGQKVARIARWCEDRLIEARFLSSNAEVARDAAAFLADPASEPARKALAVWPRLSTETFMAASFFDARKGELLPVEVPEGASPRHSIEELAELVRTGEPALLDLHRDAPGDEPRMAMVCPVRSPGGSEVLGALILSIDPKRFLYPLIKEWPTPNATAETVLIRRDGDQVVFLNELRHRPDSALNLRLPMAPSSRLPASMAALGREGLVEGDDYRGEPVLADVRAVPGSPWFVVAKVDQDEVYASLRRESLVLLGLMVALALGAGLLVRHVQSGREAELLRAEVEARRLAELALREREEDLAITLESIGDAVMATDASGLITRMNKVAEELTGWPIGDARGRPLAEVFKIVNEFSRESVESPAARVLAEGVVVGLANHTILIARDGRERPIADSGAPIRDAAGQIRGVVLVFRDQTEQQRVERAMAAEGSRREALLAAIPDIVMEVNAEKVYTWANPAGLEFFGKDVVGHEASFYFEGEQDTYRRVQSLFEGDENVFYVESWQRRKDGRKRLLAWWCRVLKDHSGKVLGAISSARDITDRKRAEDRIKADLAEKEVLLREVHHRVKNNLQVISSLLGLQANTLRDPEAREAIRQSRDRVLAMARAYEGLYRSEDLQSIRLGLYLRNLVELMRQAYGAGPERLSVELADPVVDIDTASACGLIVNELMANAFKHAFPKDRPGTVRVELRLGDGDELELMVRDDGTGLSQGAKPGAGGGLGLNLVSMLVRQLGGKLTVGDAAGAGAEFKMTLPLKRQRG